MRMLLTISRYSYISGGLFVHARYLHAGEVCAFRGGRAIWVGGPNKGGWFFSSVLFSSLHDQFLPIPYRFFISLVQPHIRFTV